MSTFITKILTTVSLITITSIANASLITNGSFEQVTFADNSTSRGLVGNFDLQEFANKRRAWNVFFNLPGWTTSDGSGIELQKNIVTSSQNGQHHVELDSHLRASNAVMTQSIGSLTIGADYLLEFYYKPRTKQNNDNGINVYWYDAAETFDLNMQPNYVADSNRRLTPNWALQTVQFTANAATMDLSFGSFGKQNTLGGLIDNVSLERVAQVSEPSTIMILIIALGLIAIRQRKQAKKA